MLFIIKIILLKSGSLFSMKLEKINGSLISTLKINIAWRLEIVEERTKCLFCPFKEMGK